MAIILSLVALAIAFAGGLGVVLLLGRPSTFNRAELCGAAVVAGAGAVSLSSFVLGMLVNGWVLRALVTVLCVGTLTLGLRRDRGAFARQWPAQFVPAAAVTWVFAAAALAFVTWVSLYRADLGWDGLFNWEAKSRVTFLNHGVFPLRAFGSGLSHIRYPLLVPLLGAWMYGWLGRIDQSALKLAGPFFYLGGLLLLTGSARRLTGSQTVAALAVAVLAAVPPATFGNGSASSGYADWPLAVIYLCALVAAHEYTRTGSAGAARLAGVTLMLGIWTKADAIVLLVCIAAVIAPRVVRWREWRMGLLVLLPGLSMQFLWSVVLVLTKASPDNGFQSHPHFGYLGILCRDAMLEFFKWKQWSLFWPLLALAVPLFIARRQLREAAPWVSGVLLPLVLYPLVFIFSAWNPVEDHVFSALPRLYLQIVPAAILFIALALYGVFEDSKRMRSDAE